jgi:OmpA-OmpF porin, OOP family
MTLVRYVVILLPILLTGCASTGQAPSQWVCAAAGALIAGGGAAAVDGEEEAALASAAIGAALGYIACNHAEEKPAPAPKPAPKPAPDPDTDGDGVLDRNDRCPGTARGTPVDSNGCPEIPNLTGVHFNHDKSEITSMGQSILDRAVSVLENNPHVGIKVVGHTDSQGADEYNQALSERRAESVQRYLAERGIDNSRMNTLGRGESTPVASNETKDGRAQNRRVDITAYQM